MAYPPPPYKDAVAGVPLAGEAIAGTWWAYPPQSGLGLLGQLPTLIIDETATVSVPEAILGLQATAPIARVDTTVVVPSASLGLHAQPVALIINQVLAIPESLLGLLAGPDTIVFVGQVFLVPSAPEEIVLTPRPCISTDVLVASACVEEILLATVDAVG